MLGDMTTASQRTLKTRIGCRGVGLHSGQKVTMTLLPAAPDTGIVFRRIDAGAEILANWVNTIESPRCTVLSNGEGITIGTVEHVMAALAGAEVDNAVVELDGPEVPIMDGSSAPPLFDRVRRARRAGGSAARDKGAQTDNHHRGRCDGRVVARSRLFDELRNQFRQPAD